MKKSRLFVANALMLTGVAFLIRAVGVAYNVYITNLIGARGVGMFSLVMSVYGLAVTVATSGVNLAATRLTAEAEGKGEGGGAPSAMRCCFIYAAAFGGGAAAALYLLAGPVGRGLLGSADTVPCLRTLALSLPFVSSGSAMAGYFTAKRAAFKSASAQLLEQGIRMLAVTLLLRSLLPMGGEYSCLALTAGGVVSEAGAFLYSFILYRLDIRRTKPDGVRRGRRMLAIALPVALSSYVRSGLVTVEHLLIPYGLSRSGMGADAALSSYGVLHGMVVPVVLFPMALLSSVAALLVPELAGALAAGENGRISSSVNRAAGFALMFGVGCAGIMLCFSGELGETLYHSHEAAGYIRALAPLIPVMYFDHIADAMLKGLDQQLYSMRVNIADSMLSVLLIYLLLPRYALSGYIAVLYISELINASLSVARLAGVVPLSRALVPSLFKSLACVVGATSFARVLFSCGAVIIVNDALSLTAHIAVSAALYLLLLTLTGAPSSLGLPPLRIETKQTGKV